MNPRALVLPLFAAFGAVLSAQQPARPTVREITVFKDGNSLVRTEGDLPVGPDGNVVYDAVPQALLGTFFPYVAEGGPRLRGAAAVRTTVAPVRTALDVRGLIEANVGAEVFVRLNGYAESRTPATIVGVLERDVDEQRRNAPPGAEAPAAERGSTVLLRTVDGVVPVSFERLQDLVFRSPPKTTLAVPERRDALEWRLDWADAPRTPTAKVGFSCLQKGLRWMPSYRIELDGTGGALVVLNATLANDLADLEDVAVHFVVGAPRLDFGGELDPIALDRTVQQLAAANPQWASNALQNPVGAFSNMSQVVMPGSFQPVEPSTVDAGSLDLDAARAEDLYVFSARGVSLPRGGRLALRVAEWRIKADEIHRLALPATPPAEAMRNADQNLRTELARLAALPKVVRYLRLANPGPHPMTTAPAAVFKEGRLLGQSALTYTGVGATTEMPLSVAVDVRTRRDDRVVPALPGADPLSFTFGGRIHPRVDVAGAVTLTNYGPKAIELEVSREIVGVFEAVEAGEAVRLDAVDAVEAVASSGYDWRYPWWWSRLGYPAPLTEANGVSRATWKLRLEPGKSATLSARWRYFAP
jgi:hypothetical protein